MSRAEPGAPRTNRAPKRARTQLAKSELWLQLGVTCDRWARDLRLAGTGEGIHRLPSIDEWPADDPFVSLMRRYELSAEDLANLLTGMGAECETRALRTGYEEAWVGDDGRA